MQPHQYALMEQIEESHWWFIAKRNFINAIIPKNRQLTILDVGCGTGKMTKFLDSWGTVTRLENSQFAQRYLRKKHISFVNESITSYPVQSSTFDLICDISMHTRERYTKHELEQKIVSCGFTIVRSSYIFFLTFPLFVFQRLLNKFVMFETVQTLSTVLNSLLISLCTLEAKLLRKINLPIGSSIIILAQKL